MAISSSKAEILICLICRTNCFSYLSSSLSLTILISTSIVMYCSKRALSSFPVGVLSMEGEY
jgi:hypothetical protein